MMTPVLDRAWQKFFFLFGITVIYIALFVGLEYLQGPEWWDEKTFWQTSLTFSDRLLPTIDQLRDYQELNTPLPFIIYGALEYLFQGGIFVGRLLNFGLSIGMACLIGWPSRNRGAKAILCLIGLFLCPYYLWLSGRLYTDIIASFFVVLGMWCYVRDRHILSGIAFILGIASRQYMLAFPVAIAAFEITSALLSRPRRLTRKQLLSGVVPLAAALSIVGWFYLFQGIAPASGIEGRMTPEVQQSLWALTPGSGLYFLSFVGLYFVIPELVLFRPTFSVQYWMEHKKKYLLIAGGLLLLFIMFPPSLEASGNLIKVADFLPAYSLKIGLFYGLALLACFRFAQLDLAFWLVLFHALMMMKAYPWDRYVLPLVIVFWYLKSIDRLPHFEAESHPAEPKNPRSQSSWAGS